MRFQRFRPSPSMIVATIALVVALGGTSVAASTVLFAQNAGKVDGIKASRKPKPNKLLALNRKGKFPASVLAVKRGPKGATGAQGLQGAIGPQGPKGDKGDPGPTASGFAHSTGGTTISNSGSGTDVIDLVSEPNTASGEAHTGAITVGYNARLVATGTLAMRNNNTASESAYCWLALNPQNAGGTEFYYWGTPFAMAPSTYATPVSVTDGIDVGPGTYNVGVRCWAYGVANISTRAADLTVIATAR